jgi:hypothetical protein
MAQNVLNNWKQECAAIHNEMDCLLKAGWPETAADRQVRKLQFMALIERRDAAARNLLQTNAQAIAPAGPTETLGQASLTRQEASKNQAPQVPPSSDPALPTALTFEATPEIKCLSILISLEP